MLDDQSKNASATFLSYDGTTWTPVLEDIAVRYEERGSTFTLVASGDTVAQEERIFTPLGVDQYVGEGDRVTLHFRGKVFELRITSFSSNTYEGFEGLCQIEFEDWGDDETGGTGGSGWDIGD